MNLLSKATAAMKIFARRATPSEKKIAKARIGSILEVITIKYSGKKMGGSVYWIHQYMQDFVTDRTPVRMRSFFVLRKGGKFYPLCLGERRGKIFHYEEAVTANSEFVPEKMKKLTAIVEAWLPLIYERRVA